MKLILLCLCLAALMLGSCDDSGAGTISTLNGTVLEGRFRVEYQGSFKAALKDTPANRAIYLLTDTTTKHQYVMVVGCGIADLSAKGVEQ